MALEQEGIYNDLSPKLREKLEQRINSFGRWVRYKFNLGRPNPDPTHYNGAIVYPSQYNLHPVQWKITDNDETDERIKAGKQKSKNIGVIEKTERDERGNIQYRYTGLRITDNEKGIKLFDMDKDEDRNMVAALELHPKNGSGLFPNKEMVAMFSRVDEAKYAQEKRAERSARKKALDAIEEMSDKDIIDFADAMSWDSTEDIVLLKNKVEELGETTPDLFNDLISGNKLKYQSVIKKGIDNKIITHNPTDGSLSWASTGQQIIALGQNTGGKNDVERFSAWMQESGVKGDAAYKKLKSLVEKPDAVNA